MRCATCDSPLPAATAEGFCPRCALTHALALGDTTAPAGTASAENQRPAIAGYEAHYELGRGSMGVV